MHLVSAEQEQNTGREAESPFPSSPRVIYEVNPLVEVICQLRFPPILRIDSELPAAFQECIRGQYPVLQERADGIELPEELPRQIAGLLRSSFAIRNRPVGYDFLSSDGIWTVGLTREFLSLGTSKYERWETFREQLAVPVRALLDIYRPSFFTRVGLRYQDLIQRSLLRLEGQTWASLLQPHITGLLSASDLNADISATFAQTSMSFSESLGQVTLRHGLVKAPDRHETCYLFDADFFTNQRIEIEHAYEKLDYFNRQSGRLFRWCIGTVLHEAMGPKPVLS
jgi:uncharacterized protein (TIGR04255 family)